MSKEFHSPNLESKSVEELTLQLMEAHSRLQEMQKEREMILANISHDLRAPLTAIRSAVDLALSDASLSKEDLTNTIALIDRRTRTLEDLINDMYYLFCIEDSSRSLNTTKLDACSFLEEYFYDAIIDSRYDNFDMQLDVPSDLKCTIDIDLNKMTRVLDNLLTNAAKYAGDNATYICLGAKIVDCASTDAATSRKQLSISVSDNGCGIAPEALPHIFTRTYTISSSRTPGSQSSGSGLGLSIARAIVEKLGGSISVQSTLNVGTEFTILLPCSTAEV